MSIDYISDCIRRVSEEEILPRFRNLEQHEITVKSPGDLVSIADTEAEKALSAALLDRFPSATVSGEEAIANNPNVLAEVIAADSGFLIDPVDGTNNFIKGDKRFALMLTQLRKGAVVAAWIFLPASNIMAIAEKGGGTRLNGERIIIPENEFDPATMIAAAHLKRFPDDLKKMAKENMSVFHENRPAFCAGYDYISLLEGKKAFSLYHRTLPWDHLPGALLFSEAGGYVRTLLEKQEYTVHDRLKGLLSATNEEQWRKIREMIFPGRF